MKHKIPNTHKITTAKSAENETTKSRDHKTLEQYGIYICIYTLFTMLH